MEFFVKQLFFNIQITWYVGLFWKGCNKHTGNIIMECFYMYDCVWIYGD